MKKNCLMTFVLSLAMLFAGTGPVQAQTFIRGDVNGDGRIDNADIIALVNYLHTGLFNKVLRSLSFQDDTTAVNKTYGDANFTITAAAAVGTDDGSISYESSNTAVADVDAATGEVTIKEAGETMIIATISVGEVYASATVSYTLTVSKAAFSATASIDGWTYGSPNEPFVSGNIGNGAVCYFYKAKEADDDTYTDSQPTAVGTYQVKASIAETVNYAAAETEPVEFSISQKTITVTGGITAESKGYDGTTDAVLNTEGATIDGVLTGDEVSVVSATGVFTDTNAGTDITVIISDIVLGGADVANYVLADAGNQDAATANITPIQTTITAETTQSTTYNGSPQPIAASGEGTLVVTYYTNSEHTENETTTAPTNAGTYYAVVSQGDANYYSEDVYVTYTISKLEASIVTAPSIVSSAMTYNGSARTLVNAGTATSGGTIEYYVSTSSTTPTGGSWSSSVPSRTNAGTYYIWYRLPNNDNQIGTEETYLGYKQISKANGLVQVGNYTDGNYGCSQYPSKVTTNLSGGTLSASSSNPYIAWVNISGTTINIQCSNPNNSNASVKITITSAATTNYNAASTSFTVTVYGN